MSTNKISFLKSVALLASVANLPIVASSYVNDKEKLEESYRNLSICSYDNRWILGYG